MGLTSLCRTETRNSWSSTTGQLTRMHVAPAYADRFCLVGKDAAEREAVIQMQDDFEFFCLAQCQ